MFGAALLYYVVRYILFGIVVGAALFVGMKLRKNKDQKNS